VAVTVTAAPVLVLDEEYRVVEVSPALQAGFGLRPGESAIDGLPGSRSLFVPYCEHARRTGDTVDFAQFYGGSVVHVHVVPKEGMLLVSWETLGILDVLTLDGLRSSLRTLVETLTRAEDALRRDRMRRSLRLVGGGG
jgi:hypothetical protein